MWDVISAFWLQHAPVLSVLLPVFTAVVLLLIGDPSGMSAQGGGHDDTRLRWRRRLSLASMLLGAFMAASLVWHASQGELLVYQLGEWPAPFGIVLVVDRLSALMVLLTYAVAVPAMWYATGGWDCRGRHFHALFQFQLMGLCGAFLTGDLFNLFVFFEVLLIASYVLLVHGQGRERFRMGVHYVVLNLAASGLFLIGLGMVYAVTGTLNMADVGLRVGQLTGDAALIARAAALVLLVVFGLKAAIVPLYFWLPATYAAASAPVAALFAIMTKVGVYSIIRVHWGVFGVEAGEAALAVQGWLLPLALTTSVLGVLGALAGETIDQFFKEALSPAQRQRVRWASCDMSRAYTESIKDNCPNATLVIDRFHVVKALNGALDEMRKEVWRKLGADQRKAIKGMRWLLGMHSRNRTKAQTRLLNELRKSNNRIYRAWVLKDEFEHFWNLRYPRAAEAFLKRWMTATLKSRIPSMRAFVGTLRDHLDNILTFIERPRPTPSAKASIVSSRS